MILDLFNSLFNLNRHLKKTIIVFFDVIIVTLSLIISMKLRLDTFSFIYNQNFLFSFFFIIPLCILSNLYFELYVPIIRFISGNFTIGKEISL